jgi:hypothetical protein
VIVLGAVSGRPDGQTAAAIGSSHRARDASDIDSSVASANGQLKPYQSHLNTRTAAGGTPSGAMGEYKPGAVIGLSLLRKDEQPAPQADPAAVRKKQEYLQRYLAGSDAGEHKARKRRKKKATSVAAAAAVRMVDEDVDWKDRQPAPESDASDGPMEDAGEAACAPASCAHADR